MKTIQYHAAAARFKAVSSFNFVEVNYKGPLSLTSLGYLQGVVLAETRDIPALVLRMDRALLALASIPVADKMKYKPAGALVVRPDQFDLCASYAESLAVIGVRRVVFLESQLALAYEWAEQRAQKRVRKES